MARAKLLKRSASAFLNRSRAVWLEWKERVVENGAQKEQGPYDTESSRLF